jgi:hypothetical protein
MYYDWARDYIASGDSSCAMKKSLTEWTIMASRRIWLEIMYEGKVAGFICVEPTPEGNEVELSYVKPEFRGLGLSSVAYVYAQVNYACVSVSLSNHRIAGKCAYWASLGYTTILPVEDQAASAYGLASVRTDGKGIALTELAFKEYRNKTNTLQQRILNKVFA